MTFIIISCCLYFQ